MNFSYILLRDFPYFYFTAQQTHLEWKSVIRIENGIFGDTATKFTTQLPRHEL